MPFVQDAQKIWGKDAMKCTLSCGNQFRYLLLGGMMLMHAAVMATETPKYTTLKQEGVFEIREYAPRLVADVSVNGDLDTATKEGFRLLAGFIFGDNRAVNHQLTTVSAAEGSKIAMTAPVTVEPTDSGQSFVMSRDWRVEFTMPSEYSLATLPKPNNPSIRIREVPIRTYAVVQYSGMNTVGRVNDETQRLRDWTKSQGLTITGSPELARYNPPWTLPMFRRNEILVPVRAGNIP